MTTATTATARYAKVDFALDASYRCGLSRCHAQAWVEAEIQGADFYYCLHHFVQHEHALLTVATRIVDHSSALRRLEGVKE